MRIALYQPDIPQNTGTLLRFGVCMNINILIIEPAGFDATDRGLKRAGMDYLARAKCHRFDSFDQFMNKKAADDRLVLLTTKAKTSYTEFNFRTNDILLLGRESSGVPEAVHQIADESITIPMQPESRSLNMALSAAMVAGEAMRQTNLFSFRLK